MARLSRLVIAHQQHHIMQWGNNRQNIFRDADDYTYFLSWMAEAARQFKVAVHAYALLPDHLHLLATPSDAEGLSRMMQWLGRHYVPYFNRKYKRTGTLWQGRYKATVMEPGQYFLKCSAYIELSPVRSGLGREPADYPWSSYLHHTGARHDALITEHSLYWGMGNTPFQREAAYKELVEQGVSQKDGDALLSATEKGWLLGSAAFKAEMEKQTERRVSPGKRGRPHLVKKPQPQEPA
ncbi:transposase [Undibacterium sp. TJN25]|uniref:transposase n=1 Tax=Undibacterium sp. TJN25 TaxID=3413056 RepID=UPI003BF0E1FE